MNPYFWQFNSIQEFIELTNKPHEWLHNGETICSKLSTECSVSEMEHRRKNGWPEGLERAEKALEGMEFPRLPSIRKRQKWGPQGTYVDMRKVYAGQLDRAFRTVEEKEVSMNLKVKGHCVTVVCAMGASALESADNIFWQGVLGYYLVKALEDSGRSVRLIGVRKREPGVSRLNNTGNAFYATSAFTLKDFGEDADYERIIFQLGSACYYRRYMITGSEYTELELMKIPGFSKDTLRQGAVEPHITQEDFPEGYFDPNELVMFAGGTYSQKAVVKRIEELKKLLEGE